MEYFDLLGEVLELFLVYSFLELLFELIVVNFGVQSAVHYACAHEAVLTVAIVSLLVKSSGLQMLGGVGNFTQNSYFEVLV